VKRIALIGVSGALAIAGMIGCDAVAQEAAERRPKGAQPLGGEHHLVLPVQTELQRLILGKDVSVFVTLDLMGVVKDGTLNQSALGSIRRDLAGAGARDGIVHFRVFHEKTADTHENKRLHEALRGLARAEGFRGAKLDEELRNDDLTWRARVATIDAGRPRSARGDEAGLGTDSVRIYPVRTTLSRYLFEGSDCVVDCLAAPVLEVEDRVRVTIKATVPKLALERKQQILFRVPADQVEERSRVPLQEELRRLANSLGFQRSRVSY
jgi:hypothetical protein